VKTGMKALYDAFCRLEETVVQVFLVVITFLVFASAIFRTIGMPLNWATDLSLLLIAWTVFLGADMALRNIDLVRVDLIVKRFSPTGRKAIYLLWYVIMLVFLVALVRYGVPLAMESSRRLFQTLGISYSWATISVPIGSMCMMITIMLKMVKLVKTPGPEEN
jgi:C4-dicarboxylate transporter DctQ subunit